MAKEKKKGTSGNAKAYITRAKAMKKLQLSIDEFRRLCILKGIFPRNPRKKFEGTDKTYYLRKDIEFLAHERLIAIIREQNAIRKKVVKAHAKRRIDILKQLSLSAPRARLDHLVVERYPRFEDALRELDDPLCIISLFANIPAERRHGITPHRISNCQRLLREFCNFVVETRALKKAFVSIKGYYFQASINATTITWITPHRFTQLLPTDVDFSVMLTFLELYECILSFVNFRLYTSRNFSYPPKVIRQADANALHLGSLLLEKANPVVENQSGLEFETAAVSLSEDAIKAAERIVADAAEEEEELDEEEESDGEREETSKQGDQNVPDTRDDGAEEADLNRNTEMDDAEEEAVTAEDTAEASDVTEAVAVADGSTSNYERTDIPKGVFAGKSVILGREVPFIELQFTLMAAGATRVTREDDLGSGNNQLEGYTHWVIDRPAISGDQCMSLEYVQPQYVFDSINANVLLPPSLYSVGAHLPPHLSPFVTAADDGGYKPWYQDMLERIKDGDASVVAEAAAAVYADGEAWAKKVSEQASRKKGQREDEPETNSSEEVDEVPDVDAPANVVGNVNADADAEQVDVEEAEEVTAKDDDGAKDEEVDSEGEEELIEKKNQENDEKERKELAALMLSRKKMRKYKKVKGAEDRQLARKERLAKKRAQWEEERESLVASNPKKRRKVPNP